MKRLIITTVGVATMVLSGCVHQSATANASKADVCVIHDNTYQRHKCPHAKINSIIGLTNEVLADTNRFSLAASNYGHKMKMATPVFGCSDTYICLDEARWPIDVMHTKPHKLRSVKFSHVLPDNANADDLFAAGQEICREIADLLDVEVPEIEFVDLNACRKERDRYGRVRTNIVFELADRQEIMVTLIEGLCVVRAGQVYCVAPPKIEIDIEFDHQLFGFPGLCEPCSVEDSEKPTAVDRFVDIGNDQSETLAKALCEEVSQKEKKLSRRKKAAVQSAAKKDESTNVKKNE